MFRPRTMKTFLTICFLLLNNRILVSLSVPYIQPMVPEEMWKQIVFKDLNNCTLFLLHGGKDLGAVTSGIMGGLQQQDKLLITLRNVSLENVYSKSIIDNVRKLKHQCTVTYVEVSSSKGFEFMRYTGILQEFLKHLAGIIKIDEDYFIFYSSRQENIKSLLASAGVANHLKNKLGVVFGDNKQVSYYTTCVYCDKGRPILQEITVPPKKSASFQLTKVFPDFLKNFQGKQFTVSTPALAGWLIEIRKISPDTWKIRRGVMNFCFEHLMNKYNFTAKHFPSIGGGGTGFFIATNKTWIGTVGDVLSGASEIGHTTGQIYNRNKVVGFSSPIVYEWLIFTTGKPLPHFSWKSVHRPFKPEVWMFVIGCIVVAFFTMEWLLNATYKGEYNDERLMVIMYLVQSFLGQCATNLEKIPRNSTRMFISFWLIFALLITTAYRSKLVSFLAFPTTDEPPTTFKSLAESNDFGMALQYLHGAAYTLLKTSPNPIFQTIYRKMELEENDAKCFQRAIGKKFACISWDSIASFVSQKNLSDKFGRTTLIKAPDKTSFIAVGLIFRKRAVFKAKFDKVITVAHSMGLVKKWKNLDYSFVRKERMEWERATNKSFIAYSYYTSSNVLTSQHLMGTFGLLFLGIIVAVLIFCVEKRGAWMWVTIRSSD
ncbi:unnamed protein product [Orchesella dallaii]|uniref:Ionotropic glutamate receptor C-terminal domain-containing protein n=1 Tax=Orchesella dallaii TaxID=48710 RepID=A0ABP1S715_9HEXA